MTTTETIAKLKSIEPGKWFSVVNREGDSLVEILKDLIDSGEHFQISTDWTRFKRLQNWD